MWRIRAVPTKSLILAAGITIFAAAAPESGQAGFLKNGVRPGDRSGMSIVRRPTSGARKRIFAPGERRERSAARPAEHHGWFWKIHSVAASAARSGRWNDALSTLLERRKGGKRIVELDGLRGITDKYGRQITDAAAAHGVSEALLLAVIAVESNGRNKAVSHKGAQGLMQIIPATAKRFGVGDVFDPAQNIGGGAAYLSWLLREFDGDPLLALAGYNAGEGAVRRHEGVPPYAETRDYVVKVFDALAAAQQICGALSGPRHRCNLTRVSG